MIIFLYGQDTYRSKEEMRKIVEENKKTCLAGRQANADWLDFIRVDASDKEIEIFKELRQTADTVSMFGQKKLMIIENIFSSNQEIQKEILEFLKKRSIENDKDIMVVFWTEDIDAKSELFKYLKKSAECKEFKPLGKLQLRNWVKDYVTQQDGKIDSQAIDKLIEYAGNNLWRLSNELNKLLAYNQTIKTENIELFVRPEIDLNIFEMIDAIGYKNKVKAMMLFSRHIEKGADEHYLLSMFVYQFRNLIKVKSAKPSDKLGLHPFVFKKTTQQAKNFTFEDLKKIYHKLMTIDFESKFGKTDIQTALESFIVKI